MSTIHKNKRYVSSCGFTQLNTSVGFTQLNTSARITNPKHLAGFTLVETLVAITVLLLVIIGPLTIAQKGIQNAYFANEQIAATMLAQEGIEAVRILRDEVALDAYDEDSGGNTGNWVPSNCSVACVFNAVNGSFPECTGGVCGKLQIDEDTGKYVYDGDVESQFTRSITIGAEEDGGVPVTVDVTWNASTFGGTVRTVKLQTWVYDHYQRYED